ncbi:MAG: hypothetical protein PUB76_06745, partial [Oscillospiraceae bacterium]|nr:hypothetical protein [Oscillospiraceae bacterium]
MKKILSAVTAVSLLASMATSVLPAITASAADDSDSKIIWNGKNITTSLEAVDDGTYTVDGNTIRIPLSAVESGDVSFTTDVKLDTDVSNVLGTFNFWWVADNDGITFANPVGPQTTGNTSFEYNGNTVNSAFAFPSCFGSVVKTRKGYAYSVDSKLTVTFNDKVTAMNCDGAGLISNGDGTATIEYSHPTIKADGYIDKTAGTVVDKQVVTIDPSGEFKYWHYNVVADENKEYVYTKEDVTQTIPNYDPNNVPPAGSEWDDVCDMVVGASSNELKFLGTTSKDYPLIKFTTKIAKGTPEGVYTVDLAKNEMSDHDSHRYTSDSKPLTIIIGDGEAPTTAATTPAATTAATTPAVTTVATTAATKPVGNGPEFVAGNISVKPGVGYGAEDTDDYYPAQFPITVNNDPGMAGIKGIIKVPDGFADVFQLKEVSTSDEDMVPGPYQGSFEY